MVLGGLVQKMNQAQKDEIRRVMLGYAKKLSRKDFIKKFTSDTFFQAKQQMKNGGQVQQKLVRQKMRQLIMTQ